MCFLLQQLLWHLNIKKGLIWFLKKFLVIKNSLVIQIRSSAMNLIIRYHLRPQRLKRVSVKRWPDTCWLLGGRRMEYKCHETKKREIPLRKSCVLTTRWKFYKLSETRFSVANITDFHEVMRNRKEQILGTSWWGIRQIIFAKCP